jgi:hypothetical protein
VAVADFKNLRLSMNTPPATAKLDDYCLVPKMIDHDHNEKKG